MLAPRSADIQGDETAAELLKDPAELKRRVSELKEENVILAKRLQEAQRDCSRLSATYRERQWRFLSQQEPELCATLGPGDDLGAHLLLHMQAAGQRLTAQLKELTEGAERLEEETASSRLRLETAKEEAAAFEEDVRRYCVEAANHYRRLRDANAALAAERRHKKLLCDRLKDADWALDLILHDTPTRLLAADMLDAGPEGGVRIRNMQERVAELESQLQTVDLSMSGSRHAASRRAMAERELRVVDYEEGRDKDRDREVRPHRSPSTSSAGSSSRGGEASAGDARGHRKRHKSAEAKERERAARRANLQEQLAEHQARARAAARGLAVLREEAEDLRHAVQKMQKAVRKIRAYDAGLQEVCERGQRMVRSAEEQHEARLRMLRHFSRARRHVSASFENALRSSQLRRTTIQSALVHSQLHLRVLHHIMQHLLPIDGSQLPAHFYRGLIDASEKERDVLMDRMGVLANRLCRAKGRAQADWKRLHAVRCHIQALEGKLRPYVASASAHNCHRKSLPDWSAIRECQLERELQELQQMSQKFRDAAVKVENRYLQDMWALHNLFHLAVSRLEAQYGLGASRSGSGLTVAASGEQQVPGGKGDAAAEEVAGGEGHAAAEEVAGGEGHAAVEEVARGEGDAAAEEVAGVPEGAAEEVAEEVAEEAAPAGKKDEPRERQKRQKNKGAKKRVQTITPCNPELADCLCSHSCSNLPDEHCTLLRQLEDAGR